MLVGATINTMHSPVTILGDRSKHLPVSTTPSKTVKSKAAMNADERARHAAWLDWVETRTNLSDTALARKSGVSENTLTRFRNRDGAVLSSLTVRQICEFAQVPGPENYLNPSGGFSEEASALALNDTAEASIVKMVKQAMSGRTNTSPWTLKTSAIAQAGYLPGDILIADGSVPPMAGDVVCAQVYDLRQGTAETMFRIYEPPYLISTSNETAFRKPLLIDDERVIVMGTVTEMIRPRRR